MILTVHGFDKSCAWTNWAGQARAQIVERLKLACPTLQHTERKRIAKELLSGDHVAIRIEEESQGEGIVHVLETRGGRVTYDKEEAQQDGPPNDPPRGSFKGGQV